MAVNAQDFLAEIQRAAGQKPKQKLQKKVGPVPDLGIFGIPDSHLPGGPSSGGTPVQGVTAEKAEPAFPSPGANALEEGVLPKKRRKQKAAADEGQDDNGSSIQALIAKAVQAKKAVVIAEKRYDVGKGTVLELNSSQVSLTQAQLTYNQSIYDYLVAKADLDQVLGKE